MHGCMDGRMDRSPGAEQDPPLHLHLPGGAAAIDADDDSRSQSLGDAERSRWGGASGL